MVSFESGVEQGSSDAYSGNGENERATNITLLLLY